jgi:excinuclease UvrABC ATPase subunit
MRISVVDAGKRFNREWIFRNLSLELHSNQHYAITGHNGSGKSTFCTNSDYEVFSLDKMRHDYFWFMNQRDAEYGEAWQYFVRDGIEDTVPHEKRNYQKNHARCNCNQYTGSHHLLFSLGVACWRVKIR